MGKQPCTLLPKLISNQVKKAKHSITISHRVLCFFFGQGKKTFSLLIPHEENVFLYIIFEKNYESICVEKVFLE